MEENSTSLRMEFCNSTSTPDGFEPKEMRMVESSVLVGIVFYALTVFMHNALILWVKLMNDEYSMIFYPPLPRFAKFFERLLIFFSVIFAANYTLTFYVFDEPTLFLSSSLVLIFVFLKIVRDTFGIVLTILSISIHVNKDESFQWSTQALGAVVKTVAGFVVMKDILMSSWIFVIAVFQLRYSSQIFYYYFGVFLSIQIFHLLPVLIRFFPENKSWEEMTPREQWVIKNAYYSFLLKLPVVVNIIIIAVEGASGGLVFSCWMVLDVFILPISTRYIAICQLLKKEIKRQRYVRKEDEHVVEVEMGKI